ncbi:DUF1294 domain-containing protein [Psychrobacter sp. FDAARGOS_221]|uniref:DUF1294 domain-containing protein n=1 Tax=Psychrobacter sp. FDAARGOS_221 TaxID=1975705 RepID=UPI000BB55187|nr:DUF1294 domain-containing protein [Psychrobacter sp. FDAARGOS_221]PNK61268.1 DUF1294 domain-containing protein [Psychrobacter sp. FDAARGOS_221]
MTKRNKSKQQHSKRSRRQKSFSQQQKQQLLVTIGFYVVLAILVISGSISLLVAGWYVALGVVTYAVYAKDKKAAQQGRWRTPEATLHLLSVLGGWVGAMLAQNRLRHKTQKPEFRMTYYLTVIINLAGLFYIITGGDISQL